MAGLYIHIPFCNRRCIYCNFYSTTQLGKIDNYISAVCKELMIRKSYLANKTIETIYLGGGTPSLLKKRHLYNIFNTISQHYSVAEQCEITIEANPDDIPILLQESLQELPINRISMGIQSFNDKTLSFLNRRHNSSSAISAVMRCQDAGYNNISIDLMYGIPTESRDEFYHSIKVATDLQIEHLSSYCLTYEEGTRLFSMHRDGVITMIDDELLEDCYLLMCRELKKAGFTHYEISNFCRPGYHSIHNSNYWNRTPYLGVGAGAHSFNGDERCWNIEDLDRYILSLERGEMIYESERLSTIDKYNETIMLGLRTIKGVEITNIKERFGYQLYNKLLHDSSKYIASGGLKRDRDRLVISEDSLFISDSIISNLFIVP